MNAYHFIQQQGLLNAKQYLSEFELNNFDGYENPTPVVDINELKRAIFDSELIEEFGGLENAIYRLQCERQYPVPNVYFCHVLNRAINNLEENLK